MRHARRLAGLAASLLAFAPAVLKAAEAAHVEQEPRGMPQLDPTSYPSQIFWLAVTFLIFLLIATRVALPKISRVLEDRRERIDRDIARAGELSTEAEKVLAEYERLSAEGRASAQALIREANELAAAEAATEQGKVGKRLAHDIETAERRIADARKAALESIGGVAGGIAQAATERLIGVKIDAETAEAAARKAAKEIGA
jgi:F-type H+-transporting ATPase subunit b